MELEIYSSMFSQVGFIDNRKCHGYFHAVVLKRMRQNGSELSAARVLHVCRTCSTPIGPHSTSEIPICGVVVALPVVDELNKP